MDGEDNLRRPPPPRPYRSSAATLSVPASAIEATIRLLMRAGARESGIFWYGARDPVGNTTVAYVTAPRQRMSRGNYEVSPAALAEIVETLADPWKPVAQVHSHPGRGVEHSNYDDKMASSRRALSVVFPFYGALNQPFPAGCGVHEFQDGYWHLLDDHLAKQRIVVTAGQVDVRDFR
jgi:hypothetical protein